MSFEKMNTFVDEHTLLMREFLRNISTMNELEMIKNSASSLNNNNLDYQTYGDECNNENHEINFELEKIDIGKQSSILHGLLSSIFTAFDEVKRLPICFIATFLIS
jgi:hypothetical protein